MRAWLQGEPSAWPFLFCAVSAACIVGLAVMCGLLDERREAERARRAQDLIADWKLTPEEAARLWA